MSQQSKVVVFENAGVIDTRALKTFGVSAKLGSNPIGYFGTGLKYAIAILLREGLEVELWAGRTKHVFKSSEIEMRGKRFEVITMDGMELPYTTELGKNWQLWQAYRELYCNCIDEKGAVYVADEVPENDDHSTIFVVKGDKFIEVAEKSREIILRAPEALRMDGPTKVTVYNLSSKSVFYRGIRVIDLPYRSMMTYNIFESMELTEDRTLKYETHAELYVSRAISKLTDKPTIRRILTAEKDYWEHHISFGWVESYIDECSPEFLEVLEQEYKFNNDKLNLTARQVHIKKMNQNATKHYEPVALTEVEQKQLDRAVYICKRVYTDFEDYRIIVVKNLGQSTMALADFNERAMVVSRKTFEAGTKYLVSTLIEEYTHLKTGFRDNTRELQTHLFDQLCTMIENHVIREPL